MGAAGPHRSVTFLTDFADQAVVLPLVLAMAAVLAWQGWRRGAVAWLCAIGATFAVVLALKLIFLGCASVFGSAALRSPSGHVAAATVVCGGVAAILGARCWAVVVIALLAGFGIGLTRIGLHVHSWPEVAIGATIGLTGALTLAKYAGPPPEPRLWPMLLVAACVAALMHGRHLGAENAILQAAVSAGWCQPIGSIR
jgi:membrane-associated phospholipid phosphatase